METIARNGSAAIYQGGSVGQNLVKDLGGHITIDDLSEYEVKETKPNMTKIGTYIKQTQTCLKKTGPVHAKY